MSNLNKEEILALLKKTGALMHGHFELSSGFHSPIYLQCAKILQFPAYAFGLMRCLAKTKEKEKIDVVIGAATGGIVISFLMGYFLDRRSIFAERKNGKLVVRRGFEIKPGERILIVEDVITTGGTILEIIDLIKENKAIAAGLCALINRSQGLEKIGALDITCLMCMDIPTYKKEDCPLCKDKIPVLKPGSKSLTENARLPDGQK